MATTTVGFSDADIKTLADQIKKAYSTPAALAATGIQAGSSIYSLVRGCLHD
jgi:hypothetical protein